MASLLTKHYRAQSFKLFWIKYINKCTCCSCQFHLKILRCFRSCYRSSKTFYDLVCQKQMRVTQLPWLLYSITAIIILAVVMNLVLRNGSWRDFILSKTCKWLYISCSFCTFYIWKDIWEKQEREGGFTCKTTQKNQQEG